MGRSEVEELSSLLSAEVMSEDAFEAAMVGDLFALKTGWGFNIPLGTGSFFRR